jgi:tetratricopeptide (TPR) repeat protein
LAKSRLKWVRLVAKGNVKVATIMGIALVVLFLTMHIISVPPALAASSQEDCYQGKDWHRVIQACSEVITEEDNPNRARAYSSRCRAHDNKGDYDQAIADCDTAIELGPKFPFACVARCNAYTLKKEYDRAIADCDKAIELDPKSAEAYYTRSRVYTFDKRYDLAIADSSKEIELDPTSFGAFAARCLALIGKNDYDGAIADCGKAIRTRSKRFLVLG